MHRSHPSRGFTIVELLVVVSIIALLIGILLPAIGKARDQAKLTQSQANLRQLGQALATYAADWNDRQFTPVDDSLPAYGNTPYAAVGNFHMLNGAPHPPLVLGYGPTSDGPDRLYAWWFSNPAAYSPILSAINFDHAWVGFGWFRAPNVQSIHNYLSKRAFDPVFWAPKDDIPLSYVQNCFEAPYEWGPCYSSTTGGPDGDGDVIYPSYCFSPAAMFSPDVLRNPEAGGFQDPWSMVSGLRVPAMSHVRYADLKTHMLEHHWLQQRRADCNSAFADGTYDGCEPYYFNHSWESVPVTLFYDGHVAGLGVREAEAADTRNAVQSGYGLWSRDTPLGSNGYFIAEGYDFAATSFHILTTDGIRGRDRISR
jgi:prepilin-type N-terminal cleavage/methylation domain-containing protein